MLRFNPTKEEMLIFKEMQLKTKLLFLSKYFLFQSISYQIFTQAVVIGHPIHTQIKVILSFFKLTCVGHEYF